MISHRFTQMKPRLNDCCICENLLAEPKRGEGWCSSAAKKMAVVIS
jgi:hypothetical protein